MNESIQQMIDIDGPDGVDITIIGDRVWVNVNGVCKLRVQRATVILVNDERQEKEKCS